MRAGISFAWSIRRRISLFLGDWVIIVKADATVLAMFVKAETIASTESFFFVGMDSHPRLTHEVAPLY